MLAKLRWMGANLPSGQFTLASGAGVHFNRGHPRDWQSEATPQAGFGLELHEGVRQAVLLCAESRD
jgi:hypothetical protein